MTANYDASSAGNGPDGYGYGSYGAGQGWQGSMYGGDPNTGSFGGAGGGEVMTPPIMQSGGGTMSGVPGQRSPGFRGGMGAGAGGMQGLKPMLSQMFGLTPQQPPGARMHPGGPGRGPQQGRPITGFGPRPIQGPINGFGPAPGGPRMSPGGPGGTGGTGAPGRRPIVTPGGPRRVQPGQQVGY